MQSGPWCLLAAIAVLITACAGVAQAQTIMVRGAAPGARIEAVVDTTPAGSTTANPAGEATIAIPRDVGKDNAEANVFVDVCADNLRRVLIVERGKAPAAPGDGCERKDIQGLYWIRHVSTVVVTMSEPPRALLRQGSFSFKPPRVFGPPEGLIVFGGGGLTKVGNIGLFACGDAVGCSNHSTGWGGAAGIEYWVTPWLAGEAVYLKPANVKANGSGDDFRFNSVFKADVATVTAKVGIPVARVRMYGKVGGSYQDSTFETDQTTDDRTITVDDVPQTVKGGRVTYALHTQGWSWIFGGGLDVWITPRVGIYFEAGHSQLKGKAVENTEGTLDDHMNYIVLGARVRVW
jgi:OmpA-like transmembrane domain